MILIDTRAASSVARVCGKIVLKMSRDSALAAPGNSPQGRMFHE
jgi:hypothetical protein